VSCGIASVVAGAATGADCARVSGRVEEIGELIAVG
jgi:hypothetical protein